MSSPLSNQPQVAKEECHVWIRCVRVGLAIRQNYLEKEGGEGTLASGATLDMQVQILASLLCGTFYVWKVGKLTCSWG